MTCPHEVEDAAYVLGALSPAERAGFEQHLGTCRGCREAVASIAVLPGLLGRLDAATAIGAAPTLAAPPSLLERVLAAARAARRRARLRVVLVATAAVVLVATGAGVAVHLRDTPTAIPLSAMSPFSPYSKVTADIGLVDTASGSRIEMTCRYAAGYPGTWLLRLVVFGRDTATAGDQVATWNASAGDEISLAASTHLNPDEVSRVEVQGEDYTPLLVWRPR
jgi:putative zinc finger protein